MNATDTVLPELYILLYIISFAFGRQSNRFVITCKLFMSSASLGLIQRDMEMLL